jgi:hypothetical protein
MIIRLALIAFVAAMIYNIGNAAEAATSERALSDRDVTGFITALPAVAARAADSEAESPSGVTLGGLMVEILALGPVDYVLDEIAATPALQRELTAAVQPHGFAGYRDFVEVASRVMHAHMALKYSDTFDDTMIEAQRQAFRAEIMADPDLTEAEKAEILAELDIPMTEVVAPPPAADLDAVRPHMAAIDGALLAADFGGWDDGDWEDGDWEDGDWDDADWEESSWEEDE